MVSQLHPLGFTGSLNLKIIILPKMTTSSKQQRSKIVDCNFNHNGPLISIQRDFQRLSHRSPWSNCIVALIRKFWERRSTWDRSCLGRQSTMRNAMTIHSVTVSLQCLFIIKKSLLIINENTMSLFAIN